MRKKSASTGLGEVLNAARRTLVPFGPSEDTEVRKLARSYLRRLDKLATASKMADARQVRSRLHNIFSSPGAKLTAALLAYPKCENRSKSKGPPRRPKISLPELKVLARDVSMYHATGEPIRVTQIRKDGGGIRTVARFGRRSRGAQQLALDTMRAMHGDSEVEYARKGRGREVFVEQVLNGINHRGVRHVAQTDVKDFFPSVNRAAVMSSRLLPRSVLRAHITMDGQGTITTQPQISPISDRAGLWQGAIASSFVASKMIESALPSLRKRLGLVYVDNIAIGERTAQEADVRLDTLAQSLSEHPAGPFQLKYRDITRVGGDHNILGYRVTKDAPHFGGKAQAKPARAAICKHERQLLFRLMFADFSTFETETQKWAKAWPRRYSLWASRFDALHLAETAAMQHVWPVARRARRHIKDARVVFKSFHELAVLGKMFKSFLQPEPDWSAVEADINKNGSTARVSKTHRSPSEYPPSTYDKVIRRYMEAR